MALKQCCDRYGTSRGIEQVRSVVQRAKIGSEVMGPPVIDRTFHLGSRGIAWLTKFVERGVAKLDGEEEGEPKP